jgi:deazaflavin-dependent oxidoreductase (nitroreductase family)
LGDSAAAISNDQAEWRRVRRGVAGRQRVVIWSSPIAASRARVRGMSVLHRVGMAVLRGGLAAQVWIYRRSKGRLVGSVRGTPVLLLTTTGRKSGASRTRPVGYLPDGERFMVCGSNGGSDHAPAWALNLRSHPDATVEVGPRTVSVTATEVTGGDYADHLGQVHRGLPRLRRVPNENPTASADLHPGAPHGGQSLRSTHRRDRLTHRAARPRSAGTGPVRCAGTAGGTSSSARSRNSPGTRPRSGW